LEERELKAIIFKKQESVDGKANRNKRTGQSEFDP